MKLFVVLLVVTLGLVHAQWDPNFVPGRTTIVHLFEWRWDDIALECERFLGPYGYGGVQVSPVNENRVFTEHGYIRPWFERYQPVSYSLNSTRSGNEFQFKSMVKRCNAVGVRIYVDAVINHMCGGGGGFGIGTGGTPFNYDKLEYPGVPYSVYDFNGPHNCHTSSGNIEDYKNPKQVRDCRLQTRTDQLSDLNLGNGYVDAKIVAFFNELIGFGIAGFRLDASKHMWPDHLRSIQKRLNDLRPEHGFKKGSRPFIFQEVIDLGGEGITSRDYTPIGRVTEFKWGFELGKTLRKWDGKKLSQFYGDFLDGENALSFVDNHDNQRGHGPAGPFVISFKNSRLYKIAQAFTLANVYGVPRVMSSYVFDLDWQGPPHDNVYNTLPVKINPDLTCGNGWICEHRWRQIYNMVKFRNVAEGQPLNNWWDNQNNQIAFSRGTKAFIAINNDDNDLDSYISTTMPSGQYCDVISGNFIEGKSCTGRVVIVRPDGAIHVVIKANTEDPIIAIHSESKFAEVNP